MKKFILESLGVEYGVPPTEIAIMDALEKDGVKIAIGVIDSGIMIGVRVPDSKDECGEKINVKGVTEDAAGAAMIIERFKASLSRMHEFVKERS